MKTDTLYRLSGYLLLAALFMATGAMLIYRLWFGPEIDRLETGLHTTAIALEKEQLAHAGTLASLDSQRAAVSALREEGQRREAAMRDAIVRVSEAAKRSEITAQRILSSKPSVPDLCEAARIEFDQQLTQERAAK